MSGGNGGGAELPDLLHCVRHARMGQHRHMSEDVVEDIRFLDVIELVGSADELPGGEAPVGEMLEEDFVGDKSRHSDDSPAGALLQVVAQAAKIGDVCGVDGEVAHPLDELVAGSAGQKLALLLEQGLPDAVLFRRVAVPALVDGPIRADRTARFAGRSAMSGRLHRLLPISRNMT